MKSKIFNLFVIATIYVASATYVEAKDQSNSLTTDNVNNNKPPQVNNTPSMAVAQLPTIQESAQQDIPTAPTQPSQVNNTANPPITPPNTIQESAQQDIPTAPTQPSQVNNTANPPITPPNTIQESEESVQKKDASEMRIIAHYDNWKLISSKKGNFIIGTENSSPSSTAYIALEKRKNGKFSISVCSNNEIEIDKNASITVNNKSFILFNGNNTYCATSYDREQDEAIISNMQAASITPEPNAVLAFITKNSGTIEISIPINSFKRIYNTAKKVP